LQGTSFLDTNVLLRFFTRDDEVKASGALALLLRVERREERVVTSPLVIFETIFTLQKAYSVPRTRVRALLLPVLSLTNLELVDKPLHLMALDLFASSELSFADAYNATFMRQREVGTIYSWDTDFDKVPGITRTEPSNSDGYIV
jgi:predicted nucleic acid-binding protein